MRPAEPRTCHQKDTDTKKPRSHKRATAVGDSDEPKNQNGRESAGDAVAVSPDRGRRTGAGPGGPDEAGVGGRRGAFQRTPRRRTRQTGPTRLTSARCGGPAGEISRGSRRDASRASGLLGRVARPSRRRRPHRNASRGGAGVVEARGSPDLPKQAGRSGPFPRKEVIQPQVPLRLPCYDLVPITEVTFGACLPKDGAATSGAPRFRGLTGGVYKAQEHIHRGMADPRLLAIPASRGRIAAPDPNWRTV